MHVHTSHTHVPHTHVPHTHVPHTHTCTTHTHAHTHMYHTHTCTHTHVPHTCIHTHAHTHMYHIHAYTHMYTHTICPHGKVLRMALKVIAVLSTSKASLEVEPSPGHAHSTEGSSPAQSADITSRTHLNKYFRLFLIELLKIFNSNRALLDTKGSSIVR